MIETDADPWRAAAGPLDRLTKLFGLTGRETPDAWLCGGKFETSVLAGAKLADFEKLLSELVERYPDAVTLQIRHDKWIDLALDKEHPDPSLEKLREIVQDDLTLTLDVTICKSDVVTKWKLTDPLIDPRLYFSASALAKALTVPLEKLDETLFHDRAKKLVIFVPSHDIELDGPRLAVVGGTAMARWKDTIPPAALPEPLAPQAVQKEVHWIGFRLKMLAPQHLAVEPKLVADGDAIASALYARLLVCSVLYLARRSSRNADGTWTSTFISERQERVVELAEARAVDPLAALSLAKLAQWAWETPKEADDRLILVQHVVVDALQTRTAAENGAEIVRLAGDLFADAKFAWEAYLKGELKKYLAQQKELEEAVEKTTKDFSDQVQALTKSVTDSMLAAVAVIVGSFIVAVFKTPLQEVVFQAALLVYAVYLLVFPLFFGLRTTWERYRKSCDAFAARREQFEKRLTKEPVKNIVEPLVPNTEKWFRKWYWLTAGVYFVVLASLILAIVYVPPEIARWTDDFTLAEANADGQAQVVIRGRNFDEDKAIVVTHGRSTFTNITASPTLRVHGSTVLTFTANKSDLATRVVEVRQGTVGPKAIALQAPK